MRDPVRDKLAFGFDDLGEVWAKNIARPIHVFRVRHDSVTGAQPVIQRPQRVGRGLIAAVAMFVMLGATAGMWFVVGRARAPPLSPLAAGP